VTAIVVASIILIVVGWITYMGLRRRPPKGHQPNNEEAKRVEDIYYLLVMAGAGDDVARKVISDKDLLTKYRRLEEKGCVPSEIACIMLDLVEGNSKTYLDALRRNH